MYLLSVAIGVASFFVSRGPDGKFIAFYFVFAVIAAVYVTLAWITRQQPIWPHIGVHLFLFCGAIAAGMAPKPHLDEMAGMLYMFAPAAIVGMILLASGVRLLARWF
jgi:hypothetical protein